MQNKILSDVYYNPEKGFLSSSKLYKKIKEEFPDEKITMEKVSEFINNQKANQIHKSYKKKNFISIVAFFPGDIYQMDLLDFSLYSRQNHGYNFCLCVVDVLVSLCMDYSM